MKTFQEFINEDINLPIEVGDIVLGGKFKNRRIEVKDIGENEKGDITINGNANKSVSGVSQISRESRLGVTQEH